MISYVRRLFASLLLTLCVLTPAGQAQPVILYGPLTSGAGAVEFGQGLACFPRSTAGAVRSDFLTGSPERPANSEGRISLISGQDGSTVVFADATPAPSEFGRKVVGIGDANGDTITDFAVGKPGDATASVYLSGSGTFNFTTLFGSSVGALSNSRYGDSLERVTALSTVGGDVPGLAVGAPNYLFVSINPGLVAFYNARTAANIFVCTGDTSGTLGPDERFGSALTNIGDVNSDGYDEIVVGAPGANNQTGRVVVLSMGAGSSCTPLYTINGSLSGGGFGYALSEVNDLTGDGDSDFVVGAPGDPDLFTDSGRATLHSGTNGAVLCSFSSTTSGDRLGASVAGLGDINFDGNPDFAIGSPGFSNDTGKIDFYSFNIATQTCSLIYTLNGSATNQEFGRTIAGSGSGSNQCEMTGDSFPEFVVGTNADTPLTNSGSVIVYSIPTPTPTATNTATPTPTATFTSTPTPTNTATSTSTSTPLPTATPTDIPTVTPTTVPTVTPSLTPTPAATAVSTRQPTVRPTRTPKPELPTHSKFSFRIFPNGRFEGVNTLDKELSSSVCRLSIIARYTKSDLSGESQTFTVLRPRSIERRVTFVRGAGLKKAIKDPSLNQPYILHLIAKNTCGGKTFYSNVASRYLNCGLSPAVGLDEYMVQLALRLR